MQIVLTPEILLAAYRQGLFPMAESAHSPYVHWYCPKMRGQLPIEGLHIPKSLRKTLRKGTLGGQPFDIKINADFDAVIAHCAAEHESRPQTWINDKIMTAYCALHRLGHAHSVECYINGVLVGGLYGVAIGAVFFGESMFSRVPEASKVCLVHLAARLWAYGYEMLDTQFINDHLRQFGAYEVPYEDYMTQLISALQKETKEFGNRENLKNNLEQYLRH